MSKSHNIDAEVADALRQMRRISNTARMETHRSLRQGRNALRRMDTGELVGAYRQEVVDRRIHGIEDTRWESLATELERRELREAAEEARRRAPYDHHDATRSEEHTSELQSRGHLVCRLLLEKKKEQVQTEIIRHNQHASNII